MIEFADAVAIGDDARLAQARAALLAAIGPEALVDASGVASFFSGIVRVADATGAPLDAQMAADTESMRADLGINDFAAAKARLE